eukprot:scaffold128056_cov27-Phaeocystis_antarctica.AAC.1
MCLVHVGFLSPPVFDRPSSLVGVGRAYRATGYTLTGGLTGAHDRTASSETAARTRALKVYPHLGHAQHAAAR